MSLTTFAHVSSYFSYAFYIYVYTIVPTTHPLYEKSVHDAFFIYSKKTPWAEMIPISSAKLNSKLANRSFQSEGEYAVVNFIIIKLI